MSRALKSTARPWAQSKGPATRYRDRKRVTLPDGTRKELYGYGPTRDAATADLLAKVDAAAKEHSAAGSVTVRELFAEFVQHKRAVRGNKAKTTFNDLKDFRLHVAPAVGDKPVTRVTLNDLQGIQTGLAAAGKYRTAELVTVLLKSFWSYAVRRYRDEIAAGELELRNVAEGLDKIKRPRTVRPKIELWSLEQLGAFLAEAKRRYDSNRRVLMYPLFHTALAAGLRRGELLGLKRTALQSRTVKGETRYALAITEQLVHYDGKHHPDTPKTAMGERDVPVNAALASALERHMTKLDDASLHNPDWREHGLMFPSYNGTPLEPSNIYRARDEIIAALGLPKSTLHQMRKVYASYVARNMIREGTFSPKRLQALLGHSSPDTAVKIYTQLIEEDTAGTTFDPFGAGTGAGIPAPELHKEDGASEETPS